MLEVSPQIFKTTPFAHQLTELGVSQDLPVRAVFWEQGTGKTKLTIDTAAHLYRAGKIDAVLVIAPPGVHQNWLTDEIPAHLPDDIPFLGHAYESKKAQTKRHRQACEALMGFAGLALLAQSYQAFMTGEGRRTAEKFFHRRKVLYVLDESQRIKTPGAKRTISIVATGRRTPYKRILSGTPVTNKPFDIYAQLKFLDEDFWKNHGFASYEAFKTYFGIWEQRVNGATGQRFNQVVAFKNLDQLAQIVAKVSSRVTKEEGCPDLPPKVYQRRYFDLTDEQHSAYNTLKEEFLLFLDSGETVSAPLVITRLLRLQQITCGYLPLDPGPDGEPQLQRFVENPRLAALKEVLEDLEGKAIIFARFRADIDQICEALGEEAVRYDGAVEGDDRLDARQRFQGDDEIKYFVGNPAVAGTGLTLHAASNVIYYSNSFDLEHRLQSEDRAHRIGQSRTVNYIDLVAKGTVDSKIVQSLREKKDLAAQITGDEVKQWI